MLKSLLLESPLAAAVVAASVLWPLAITPAAAIGGLGTAAARPQLPLGGIDHRDGDRRHHGGRHGYGRPAYGYAVPPHVVSRPWHDRDHRYDRYSRTGDYYAAPPTYYRYADNCAWLKYKYNHTGHPYWWQRYGECRGE